MPASSEYRRAILAIDFLNELKDINSQLEITSSSLKAASGNSYKSLFTENKSSFQNEFDRYNANINRVKCLNSEITERINNWYEFVKSVNNLKKLCFPISFFIHKKSLSKRIRQINETIQSLTIENRFIRESLSVMLQDVELKAVLGIRQGENYCNYEKLLAKKDYIILELSYLLATLPEVLPADIQSDRVDSLIERIRGSIPETDYMSK
jgi:hypothetical protein